jgi:bloom syndrome protein
MYVLHKIFGFSDFRQMQREAIETIIASKDSLVLLPTGSGKTVCYAVPALLMSGVTVVITPLLSLLSDQVNKLRERGINACYIRSSMSNEEKESVLHEMTLKDTCYKLFYLTPEAATSERLMMHFDQMNKVGVLGRFVIDESHCIDTWGSSFRPSYAELGCLRAFKRPFHAFTGTATVRTQNVIVERLHMEDPDIIKMPSERSNLFFKVIPKNDQKSKDDVVKLIIDDFRDKCGMVYCSTRRDTKDLAFLLKTRGISAVHYDGALDDMEKEQNSSAWLSGRAKVICATKAFGMGIDKQNVRFVIHHTIPESMEDYFQEAGRAGRDGLPSICILLYRFEDRLKILNFITRIEDPNQKSLQSKLLDSIVKYCMLSDCRRVFMLTYFGENPVNLKPCRNGCDNCQNPKQSVPKDCTDISIQAFDCITSMSTSITKISLKQAAFTLKGSKSKDILKNNFHLVPQYGLGKAKLKSERQAIRFFQLLVVDGYLEENLRDHTENTTTPFLTLTGKACDVKNGLEIVFLDL